LRILEDDFSKGAPKVLWIYPGARRYLVIYQRDKALIHFQPALVDCGGQEAQRSLRSPAGKHPVPHAACSGEQRTSVHCRIEENKKKIKKIPFSTNKSASILAAEVL
jgi:hypothetical protein